MSIVKPNKTPWPKLWKLLSSVTNPCHNSCEEIVLSHMVAMSSRMFPNNPWFYKSIQSGQQSLDWSVMILKIKSVVKYGKFSVPNLLASVRIQWENRSQSEDELNSVNGKNKASVRMKNKEHNHYARQIFCKLVAIKIQIFHVSKKVLMGKNPKEPAPRWPRTLGTWLF